MAPTELWPVTVWLVALDQGSCWGLHGHGCLEQQAELSKHYEQLSMNPDKSHSEIELAQYERWDLEVTMQPLVTSELSSEVIPLCQL